MPSLRRRVRRLARLPARALRTLLLVLAGAFAGARPRFVKHEDAVVQIADARLNKE